MLLHIFDCHWDYQTRDLMPRFPLRQKAFVLYNIRRSLFWRPADATGTNEIFFSDQRKWASFDFPEFQKLGTPSENSDFLNVQKAEAEGSENWGLEESSDFLELEDFRKSGYCGSRNSIAIVFGIPSSGIPEQISSLVNSVCDSSGRWKSKMTVGVYLEANWNIAIFPVFVIPLASPLSHSRMIRKTKTKSGQDRSGS